MKKCLFFFLGLIAALGLAVWMGSNSGEANPQGLKASQAEKVSQADELASELPQKSLSSLTPVTKVP